MIWLRRTLALVLVMIFVLAFPALLIGFNIINTALNPRFLKEQFQRNDIYSYFVDEAMPILIKDLTKETFQTDLTSAVTDQELRVSLRKAIPPAWLQATTEKMLDRVIPYLTGRSETFVISIDLKERKTIILDELIAVLAKSQLSPVAKDQLSSQLQDQIPDGMTFTEQDLPQDLEETRNVLTNLDSGLWMSAGVLTVLLLLISLLGGRSSRGKLRWGALALSLGALLAWAGSKAAATSFPTIVSQSLTSSQFTDSTVVMDKIGAVVESSVQAMFGLVATQAVVFLIAAGVLFALSLVRLPIRSSLNVQPQ